jgi:hypothetical protein
MKQPNIATPEQWLAARKQLLDKEKELTRQHDALIEERQALPWVRVEKSYVFQGPSGNETLGDLFAGKSQLVIYHFMLGPGWKEGCPSCSLLCDHLDGAVAHVGARDVAFSAVSHRAQLRAISRTGRLGLTSSAASGGCARRVRRSTKRSASPRTAPCTGSYSAWRATRDSSRATEPRSRVRLLGERHQRHLEHSRPPLSSEQKMSGLRHVADAIFNVDRVTTKHRVSLLE